MDGRERVLRTMKLRTADRTPWVPFVGVHGGKLLGVTASEYLKSADHIVAGTTSAVRQYRPDGIPIVFDLQVEAEIFGCRLHWADDVPPAVTSHPLADGTSLTALKLPQPDDGRLAVYLDATARVRKAHPDIALYGLVTGPFTLALHLMGTEIFTKMFENPNEVRDTMAFCHETAKRISGYYVDAGCDVIAVVDPMTSQIGPDHFSEYVTPFAAPLFDHIRALDALSSFFVCGHAEHNLDAMCDCRPDNVSVDENIPLAKTRDVCLDHNISFGGNLQLTTVLLLRKPIDAQKNALECLEIAGEKGFILAPGCDLPYHTPPENLAAIADIVEDPYQREVAKAIAVEEAPKDLLDMRDYGQTDKVVVDIITLDSQACAPCQYMVEAVRKIAPEFEGVVIWREHKIKHHESIVFMTSLLVRNIPTICIDGKIRFVSRIPAKDELVGAIRDRILEKMRTKIRRKRGELFLLCPPDHCTDEKRDELTAVADRAATELGVDLDIRIITDEEEILDFGVLPSQTPAVATASYRVRSLHTVPEPYVIREWIKDIIR